MSKNELIVETTVNDKSTKKVKNFKQDGTQFKRSKIDKIFNLVKINDKIRIVIGDNIVSVREFKTFAQADKYIAEKPYEILINTACLITKLIKDEDKKQIPQEIA